MKVCALADELGRTSYPGRGIILGKSGDGKNMVIAYFIMGRSQNSRNRIFEPTTDGIRTRAFDESKMTDLSLIIYAPVRAFGDVTIVTNGDQTDTIYDFLAQGESFEAALRTRTFEPDPPNYTPRISGLVCPEDDSVLLSILKSADNNPEQTRRYFFEYNHLLSGVGYLIHTYAGDGQPLPSFEGEPTGVSIPADIDEFTDIVWDSLNNDNKVSLFTRFISLETGEIQTRIVNKNK